MMEKDMGAISGSHASHGAAKASPPVGFDPARKSVVETMREKLDPYTFEMLRRSFEDADYNYEYEQKRLSAWESPEYRPYCLRCETMRRMEHRDYGYQCSACGNKCGPEGAAIATEARRAETTGSVHEGAGRNGIAQKSIPSSDMGKGE